jgi:hypothetical protein
MIDLPIFTMNHPTRHTKSRWKLLRSNETKKKFLFSHSFNFNGWNALYLMINLCKKRSKKKILCVLNVHLMQLLSLLPSFKMLTMYSKFSPSFSYSTDWRQVHHHPVQFRVLKQLNEWVIFGNSLVRDLSV